MPHVNFAFWGLVTAAIAYCVPDWHQMQLIFSVPMLALLISYWILPESPRLACHVHVYRTGLKSGPQVARMFQGS